MNHLKSNFKRNKQINPEYCINECKKEFDNNHLTWCDKINEKEGFKFIHLLNGRKDRNINSNQI